MSEVDPIDLVQRFIADIARHHHLDAVMAYLTNDIVYHNMPSDPIQGAEAVRETFQRMFASIEPVPWQIRHIAVTGNVVLTERIDPMVRGGQRVDLPVMGAFEVRDGKIAAWRDYWDRQTLQQGLSGATAAAQAAGPAS